jgi:hypothetical protein
MKLLSKLSFLILLFFSPDFSAREISSWQFNDLPEDTYELDDSSFRGVAIKLPDKKSPFIRQAKKKWSFFVYIAARNDLHPFSKTNIRQMLEVGSNENINIVVQLDEPGKNGTQRFFIEKNKITVAFQDQQRSNSGDPETLINFCHWGVTNFPADRYALVLWDHGTGSSIDPYLSRSLDPLELFSINPTINRNTNHPLLSLPCLEEEKKEEQIQRGICFDDAYKSYINNQGLMYAFKAMDERFMHGTKWSVVGCDACLMADLATLSILKNYAEYFVASEDVEPGTGWNYRLVLSPFLTQDLDPESFARHIANSYAQAYNSFISDYTMSAMNLTHFASLEQTVQEVSLLLLECLRIQKDQTVKEALRLSCNRRLCTSFDEPSYKDLHHLFSNILRNLELFRFTDTAQGEWLRNSLKEKLTQSMNLIKGIVVANCAGKSWPHAQGITIYMPETRMHSSFPRTTFALSNAWYPFLKQFLTA